jgi:hypothetical protein
MDRSPWYLAIIVPVGILAIGFMVYTLSLLKEQHVAMLLTMLSDVALLTLLFNVTFGILWVPAERSKLFDIRAPRRLVIVISCLLLLLGFSTWMHAVATVPLLNSRTYLAIVAIPLLLVLLARRS